ncbi:IS110 family transposase [Neobacillus mesonae]|uniref:IS110 family transposase n=1 Tax=Neobacillus mesonae TaxID=1193713 RepID=UPI00204178FB|nr:IS110 family transposase [Neobacillus mesonae]MCM3570701.1 IS110 family transposase [Neobacillus mesonae]
MDILLTHCAGMDVHQKEIVVCALTGSSDEVTQKEIKSFSTLTKSLFDLLKWLEEKEITHIAMESTGIYWKPVYNILEGYFDITIANAQRIKNVPGRKTDVSDAEWIAKLLRYGLIEKSFVPSQDLRELRDLTRLRKKWIGNLTSEKNRISKVLECSNIKLGSVISDIFGVSGRNLLNQLVKQGYLDKADVDANIHHSLRKKAETISESLFGTLNAHQMFMIKSSWNHIEYLEKSIQELETRIEAILTSYQEEKEILLSIPGVKDHTAACIIAEIGRDMNQFPTSRHLASWAGVSPGNNESAGKKSTKSVPGNPHIKSALCELSC